MCNVMKRFSSWLRKLEVFDHKGGRRKEFKNIRERVKAETNIEG